MFKLNLFQIKVGNPDPITGCMIWQGAKSKNGYGNFVIDGVNKGSHVVAWELHTGTKVPKDMCICHHCDNRLCVNPEHLFLGTQKDNIQDCLRKGRIRNAGTIGLNKGEKNGRSKLSKEQVIEIRNSLNSLRHLAEEYGVSFKVIGQIKRREIWSHV